MFLGSDQGQPGGGVTILAKESFSVTVVSAVSVQKNLKNLASSVSLGNSANCEKHRPPSALSTAISDQAHLMSSHLSSEIILLCIDLNLTQLSAPTRPDPTNLIGPHLNQQQTSF